MAPLPPVGKTYTVAELPAGRSKATLPGILLVIASLPGPLPFSVLLPHSPVKSSWEHFL